MIPVKMCMDSRELSGSRIETTLEESESINSLDALLPITRSGSGTPSSTNIRSFILWDEVVLDDGDGTVLYKAKFNQTPQGELHITDNLLIKKYGYIESYNGEDVGTEWYSDRDADGSASPTIGAEVVYRLEYAQNESIRPNPKLPTYSEGDTIILEANANGNSHYDSEASGSIVTIPAAKSYEEDGISYTETTREIKSLVIGIEPVQSGSGTPSPDNVRPISGWTGAEIFSRGKNLLPINEVLSDGWTNTANGVTATYNNGIMHIQGTHTSSGWTNVVNLNWTNSIGGKRLPSGCTLRTPSTVANATSVTLYSWVDGVNRNLSNGSVIDEGAVATTHGCYVAVHGQNTYNFDIPMVVTCDSQDPNTYEPYYGTTYPISWQTEAGTVYGGTLDVVSGELVVDRAMVDMGALSWTYNSGQLSMVSPDLASLVGDGANVICSNYPTVTNLQGSALAQADKVVGINKASTITTGNFASGALIVKDTDYTNATDFKTAVTGQTIVYELATPTTYQLTPTEVTSLLGDNNIWADTGDVEVKWRTLLNAEKDIDLDIVIGQFKEYHGMMCGSGITPALPTNPLKRPLLKPIVNGEDALLTTDCATVVPCGALAVVCETTVCNTVVGCDEE